MRVTEALKQWLIDRSLIDQEATEDQIYAAVGKALVDGALTPEELEELTTDATQRKAKEFAAKLEALEGAVTKLVDALSTKDDAEEEPEEEPKGDKAVKPESKEEPTELDKAVAGMGGTPEDTEPQVRVKEAADHYDKTKKSLTYPQFTKAGKPHPFAGRPVLNFGERGRPMDEPSELDKAVAGAYAKLLCATAQRGGSRTFGWQALPEHDKELLQYAMRKMKWCGSTNGGDYADIVDRPLTELERKALIDDAVSGGLEAAPIVFDDQVIQTPLLHGELLPLVNMVPLDRGRRVEGVSTSTVTGSWGGVDDTAISLFDTASYVSAFDTTIFRWEGAIRIGLDFLSDTPIDFGAHITAQYGERLLEDLDDVIAAGNGTSQPEGVINKSGVTSVSFGGSTTLGNYESLRFGVAKAEHRPNVVNTAVFCGTETSYQRARAIPVGTSDARRLGGMDYSSYTWMERPYKINESLTNQQIFYAVLARYRMYRRRGLTIRTSTEGDTLIRRNEMLIVAMARYGGQLERGAAAAVTTDAPA